MPRVLVTLAAVLAALALAAPAQAAARTCAAPGPGIDGWQRATPEEAGMDAAALQDAVDYAASQASFSLRVYRHGCLVTADRTEGITRGAQFESWSLAKSVTAMVFGRAMTLGLISPDDPVGALVTEADAAHGAITLRELLTMTSGLRWNGLRDYNIAMRDRLRDFLTVDVVHEPGTWFEYSQTGPFMVAEAVQRAVGEDFQAFAQRELFGPLGITPNAWQWSRDGMGRTQGFMGVNMSPDDFGRLGDLMRRGGVFAGKRLLSRRFMREALTPAATNGCYGWMIWLNRARPCIGPTVTERPVEDRRSFPGLPADLFRFSGLFGQLVTVFPSQDVVVVRTGQDPDLLNFAGGAGWEDTLYRKVLGAITDEEVPVSGEADSVPGDGDQPNPDKGFQLALLEPEQYLAPIAATGPVPAAGPARSRASQLRFARRKAGRRVTVRVACPPVAALPCTGHATLTRARSARRYDLEPGDARKLRFRLQRRLRRAKAFTAAAVNADQASGTRTELSARIRPAGRR